MLFKLTRDEANDVVLQEEGATGATQIAYFLASAVLLLCSFACLVLGVVVFVMVYSCITANVL